MRMPDVATEGPGETLPAHLRAVTAPLHAQVEAWLGLPDAVRNRHDYGRLLERFFGLYQPIERSFRKYDEWGNLGLSLADRNHSTRLSRDLAALGTDPGCVAQAPAALLPDFPTFPHALGALYVLEGSTLGGRIILRALEPRLGQQIAGATHFFNGHGVETGPTWQSFCVSLNGFERSRPSVCNDVRIGAERLYRAILTWFPKAHQTGKELA